MNDINSMILAQLNKIAVEYMSQLNKNYDDFITLPIGNYSAKEIRKLQLKHKFPEIDTTECRVSAGTFEMVFPKNLIFEMLARFEATFKPKSANRIKLVREMPTNVIAEFIVTIPKESKALATQVSTDNFRPNLCGVCIDTANNAIVATDTGILSEVKAEIELISGEHKYILVDAKSFKQIAGQTTIIEVSDNKTVTITADNGIVVHAEVISNYVAYRRVLPKLSRNGYIKVCKEDVKNVMAFAKSAKEWFDITVDKGSDEMILKSYDAYSETTKSAKVKLEFAARNDIRLRLSSSKFTKMGTSWLGGLWFNDSSRPLVLDCKGMLYTLLMPLVGKEHAEVSERDIECLERHNSVTEKMFTETSEQIAAAPSAAPQTEQSVTTTIDTAPRPLLSIHDICRILSDLRFTPRINAARLRAYNNAVREHHAVHIGTTYPKTHGNAPILHDSITSGTNVYPTRETRFTAKYGDISSIGTNIGRGSPENTLNEREFCTLQINL